MTKGVIQFGEEFYNTIKEIKKFIKPYFLDVHKGILFSISTKKNTIKCEINYGRYVLQFIETPVKLEGFSTDFSLCLSIEDLEKYGKLSKSILLFIKDDQVFTRVNDILLELQKQSEAPNMEDLPYIKAKPFSEEITKQFNSVYKACCQKENLITFKEDIIYEKISDYLYRIEDNFTDLQYSFSVDDLKMINVFLGNEPISFNTAPKYHVLKTSSKTLHILKYKNDTLNLNVISKKKKLNKSSVTNATLIDTNSLKTIIDTVSISGVKVFGLVVGSEPYISANGTGYKIKAETKLTITNQEFLMDKKELTTLLKFCKEPTMTIVAGKDFMIINKRFVLLMRSIFNNEE